MCIYSRETEGGRVGGEFRIRKLKWNSSWIQMRNIKGLNKENEVVIKSLLLLLLLLLHSLPFRKLFCVHLNVSWWRIFLFFSFNQKEINKSTLFFLFLFLVAFDDLCRRGVSRLSALSNYLVNKISNKFYLFFISCCLFPPSSHLISSHRLSIHSCLNYIKFSHHMFIWCFKFDLYWCHWRFNCKVFHFSIIA